MVFWIILILLLLAFVVSASGKAVIGVGTVALAIFLIYKITGLSFLVYFSKFGLIVIIIIIASTVLFWLLR